MMNRILLACLFGTLGLATACGSSPPPPQPAPQPIAVVANHYSGHWEGAARVSAAIAGAPENMDIVAVLVDGGGASCGTIEYSHAGCSGIWSCASSDYNADVLSINETIRFGGERCPTGANVELRRTNDPNVLEFRYSHAAGIQAVGQINRRRIQ
ncbi:MAG: hypothetical protein AB8I08_10020 [Sandaracinaceae bacterium]